MMAAWWKIKYFVETMVSKRRETPLKEANVPYDNGEVTKPHFGGWLTFISRLRLHILIFSFLEAERHYLCLATDYVSSTLFA